mmetsp:Transcript_29152/g.113206  ORF Transcript_29152/g.113206 Transcript_29152/m.113206 type:complete len:101 (+) Transcript_29152:851-1153(+)
MYVPIRGVLSAELIEYPEGRNAGLRMGLGIFMRWWDMMVMDCARWDSPSGSLAVLLCFWLTVPVCTRSRGSMMSDVDRRGSEKVVSNQQRMGNEYMTLDH